MFRLALALKAFASAMAILILAAGCVGQNPTAPTPSQIDGGALAPGGVSSGIYAYGEG
jgi:hypothetical protein